MKSYSLVKFITISDYPGVEQAVPCLVFIFSEEDHIKKFDKDEEYIATVSTDGNVIIRSKELSSKGEAKFLIKTDFDEISKVSPSVKEWKTFFSLVREVRALAVMVISLVGKNARYEFLDSDQIIFT